MYHIELYYSNFHFSLTFFSFFIKNIVGINAPNEVEAHLPAGDLDGFDDVDIQPKKNNSISTYETFKRDIRTGKFARSARSFRSS